ncbi:MFS transporter [Clostridium guangxiense]|uniref:MFS transporter n=1 Tax=Clostridium guangxiense TaxID=1662055 RepID=UPI001E5671F0|nr:MFS transporter [Clostridium guangxiense]MCD2347691.1 MFS transporter [Clostridium guangxiense]
MKKDNILLLIAVFLLIFGTYITGAILTPYAKSLGASGISIGLISAALYIVRLFVGTPIGKLSDKKGILSVLKYSIIMYPFTALIYCFAVTIPVLIFARFTHGLASAMMLPMVMAYIGQISPLGKEGFYMGIYNTANLIASGIGPQTATILASAYSKKSCFVVSLALSVISLLIVIALHKSKTLNSENKNSITIDSNSNTKISSSKLLTNHRLLALSSINIASAFIITLISFFFILFTPQKSISLVFTGFLISIYNVVGGFAQIPMGKFSDKFNKCNLVLFSGIIVSLLLILFPYINNLSLMISLMLLLAVVSAAFVSASSALSTILGRTVGMGSTMGFLGTANSVGMVLASVFLSVASDLFGLNSLFYLSSAVILICTLLFAFFWKNKKDEATSKLKNASTKIIQ